MAMSLVRSLASSSAMRLCPMLATRTLARSFSSMEQRREFDQVVQKLSRKYLPLADELLRESIRIPADHLKTDPKCGTSNHEGPRLEYLRRRIFEIGAVEKKEDVFFDAFGNLVWRVYDKTDGVSSDKKKHIYFDGHTDTVNALPEAWTEKVGEGCDAYNGMTDPTKMNESFLRSELGYIPPKSEWGNLIFGRGSADQLCGVIDNIIATKVMLETKQFGSLKGIEVRSYGTVTEEDNDGGAPMYVMRELAKQNDPTLHLPDAVVLTEGTGHRHKTAMGIYRGQRGRMQIEVEVVGRSCHGSMPQEGLNPLEWAGKILSDATDQVARGEGVLNDPFLGKGTRTASFSQIATPSICAVPEKFTFRFDRRTTKGEDPIDCLNHVEKLPSVAAARKAGLKVTVRAPLYSQKTWTGYPSQNEEIYMSWVTPEDHPAVTAAVKAYKNVVTPMIPKTYQEHPGSISREPRVECWVFSTDGVGFPVRKNKYPVQIPASKRWVSQGNFIFPPIVGLGAGYEHNTHKIGECVDKREMEKAIAFYARYPSQFRDEAESH